MKLTRFTDYGLRVLTFLALKPQGQLTNISDVAEVYNISRNHVVKIVHSLSKADYLKTTQGKGGGIQLQRSPEKINLGELIRHLEPTFESINCDKPECLIKPACDLKSIYDEARDAFLAVLDKYTLADLIKSPDPLREILFETD